jgi:transcriptional regulator with XRE-family HTH domain
VPLTAKHFAERLNTCLDDTDAPAQVRDRALILSKMLNIPKQQAWAFLEGQQIPDSDLLQHIANEFEVDPKWLSGEK